MTQASPNICVKMFHDLSLGFLNVCSLRYKVRELEDFVHNLDLDIFFLAETWLDDTIPDGFVSISNYFFLRRDRQHGIGGGVGVYFKSSLLVTRRPELEADNLECLVVSMKGLGRTLFLACAYRPPSSPPQLWSSFSDWFDELDCKCDGHLIVTGDFNDDLLRPNSTLSSLISLSDLVNHVPSPTRVTASSSTLLDVILARVDHVSYCSVRSDIDISDHYPILATVTFNHSNSSPTKCPTRSWRFVNWENFKLAAILRTRNFQISHQWT